MGGEPGSGAQVAGFGFEAERQLQCGAEVGAGTGGQSTEYLSASGVSCLCFGVHKPDSGSGPQAKEAGMASQPGIMMPGFGSGTQSSGFGADIPGDESGTENSGCGRSEVR